MKPLELLAATEEGYRSISVYRDRGRVTVRTGGATPFVDERSFATEFIRPDPFRFELQYRHHAGARLRKFVVCAASGDTRIEWNVAQQYRQPNSLSAALAAATGISYGAARAIPGLLMEEVGGRKATDLTGVISLGDDLLDGVACHRIVGHAPLASGGREESPRTLWIERESLLIRQIEWTIGLGVASAQTMIEYDPTVGPLSDTASHFDVFNSRQGPQGPERQAEWLTAMSRALLKFES